MVAGDIIEKDALGSVSIIQDTLYWDSTNNRLGLNTSAPLTYLHINGTTDASLSEHGLLILGPTNSTNIVLDQNEIIARDNGSTSALHINPEGGNILISESGTGRLGIGTASPNTALEVAGEIAATGANAFRAVQGNYGVFLRNDGSNTYLLLTASGDQYGTWNTLRPLIVSNVTGSVTINGVAITGGSITQTAVTAPTLLNSWVNFGSIYAGAGHYLDKQGRVHLTGLIKNGSVGSAAFQLPVGQRPAASEIFSCISNGTIGRVDIGADGYVIPQTPSNNAYQSLAGISFRVA